MTSSRVSCKERDFLEQDPPLRGQNYVCLSFLFPEDVIVNKEAWMFSKFLQDISRDLTAFFDNSKDKFKDDPEMLSSLKNIQERYDYVFSPKSMDAQYKFFKDVHGSELDQQYTNENDFITNIRGIKIRGVYDTLPEAQKRAQYLQKKDPKFNLVIGEVGSWCPLSPNLNDIENQEYCETELNSLMKKYKESQEESDMYHQKRQEEMVKNLKISDQGTSHQSLEEKMKQDEGFSSSKGLQEMIDQESNHDPTFREKK